MTTFRRIALTFVFAVVLFTAVAAHAGTISLPPQVSLPSGEGFGRFPLTDGPLTNDEVIWMRLTLVRLEDSIAVENFSRKFGQMLWQRVLPGTEVWVDPSGEVRYLAGCGNRVVVQGYLRYLGDGKWATTPPKPPAPLASSVVTPTPKHRVFDPVPLRLLRSFVEWFWTVPAEG